MDNDINNLEFLELYKENQKDIGFGFNFYTMAGVAACVATAGIAYLVIDNLFFLNRRIKAIMKEEINTLTANIINGINGQNEVINGIRETVNNINNEIVPMLDI